MDKRALPALAEAHGVAGHFRDFRNESLETPLAIREQVLERMGVYRRGDDPQQRLDDLEQARWEEAMPSLLLVDADKPLSVALRLPAEQIAAELTLVVTAENNAQSTRSVCAREAPVLATHRAGPAILEHREITVAHALSFGYYTATLVDHKQRELGRATLFVTPPQAFRPRALSEGRRLYGLSAQLYSLRSQRNWGIGDFTDLCTLVRGAAAQGADLIGISPLHALFPADPGHFSPYSPSNRAFLNVMFIDPEALADFVTCAQARARVNDDRFRSDLQALRETHGVDYAAVAAAKLPVLEQLYQHFAAGELASNGERGQKFRRFTAAGGEALFQHALYDSLHEHFLSRDAACRGWPAWPSEYRDPRSDAVRRFAIEHAERVQFFLYLQWCAEEQLAVAQALATSLGMAVGIYLDLAVGVDLNGSEVWSNQPSFALGASAGAPPDELARSGQDWGFPPLCPRHLENTDYALFLRNLRASMARCGAVRYDHAVSLERLWWIPEPGDAARGAFVHYDLDTLLALLALESQREQCLVIGEDLGTVPPRLRESMAARHIFSYKVLYFEKQDGQMRPPTDYPPESAATITTHDLATLASWWDGSDIDLRANLGLLGSDEVADQLREERAHDRGRLLRALGDQGCWQGSVDPAAIRDMDTPLSTAIHRFLALSTAGVMLTQLEDLMEMLRPVNVPGTSDEYANWQRKLRYPLEGLFERDGVAAICAGIRGGRSEPS